MSERGVEPRPSWATWLIENHGPQVETLVEEAVRRVSEVIAGHGTAREVASYVYHELKALGIRNVWMEWSINEQVHAAWAIRNWAGTKRRCTEMTQSPLAGSRFGDGRHVYRSCPAYACGGCLMLYTLPNGQPRLFTVAEVDKDGSLGPNSGAPETWTPRIGATHDDPEDDCDARFSGWMIYLGTNHEESTASRERHLKIRKARRAWDLETEDSDEG